jgi:hypothetical protein
MQASPIVNRSGFFFIARDCAGLSGRAPAVHPVRLPEADPSEGRSAARPDCNHDPRKRVLKDFSPDYLDPRDSGWLLIWLYKIDRDLAVAGSENTRRNLNNSRECGRVANRPYAFRSIASKCYKVLGSPKRRSQGLPFRGRQTDAAIAFYIVSAI